MGRPPTHGHFSGKVNGKRVRSPTYITWCSMKARCYYPKTNDFKHYGGRGIGVCDRWRNSFEQFLLDMGTRPVGHSIDRIDPNGDYTPDNCRWSTPSEQAINRRRHAVPTK